MTTNVDLFSGHPEKYADVQKWRAIGVRAIDGDSYDVLVDQGFDPDMSVRRVRLDGADTWERRTPTLAKGNAARDFAASYVVGQPLLIYTRKAKESDQLTRTFERYVARVEVWKGGAWVDLAAIINDTQHVKRIPEGAQ